MSALNEKPFTRSRMILITLGIMLSSFLGVDGIGTVVSTAMPTIVGKLGGLSIYSWAFAAYMITSTTATPIYGKLSDVLANTDQSPLPIGQRWSTTTTTDVQVTVVHHVHDVPSMITTSRSSQQRLGSAPSLAP